jgi:hypothetical protein
MKPAHSRTVDRRSSIRALHFPSDSIDRHLLIFLRVICQHRISAAMGLIPSRGLAHGHMISYRCPSGREKAPLTVRQHLSLGTGHVEPGAD